MTIARPGRPRRRRRVPSGPAGSSAAWQWQVSAACAVLALVIACLNAPIAVASGDVRASPVRVSTTTAVPCAFWNQQLPTDWYLPPAAPIGLLYAQHGFGETRSDWVDFATSAAAAGFVVFAPTLPTANLFGCTVQSLGDNTRFLTGVATLFAQAGNPSGSLASSFAAALVLAGRNELALPGKLAIVGHSIGAEAALYVASRLVGDGRAGADLRGVLLADPVRSFAGGNLAPAIRQLAGSLVPPPAGEGIAADSPDVEGTVPHGVPLPILTLAAPAQACNAQRSGTRAVIDGLPNRTFFGAALTTGSHADIFGGSVNKNERLTCGLPRQVNIDATRTLALGWLTDAVTGRATAELYPGGGTYDTLISKGVISTLR